MTALGINSNGTAGRRLKEAQRLGLIEQFEPPGGFGKTTARRYRVLIPSVDLEKRHHSGVFPSPDAVRDAMRSENCTGYTACTPSSEGEGVSAQEEKVFSDKEPEDLSRQGGKDLSIEKTVEITAARRVLRGRI